MTLISHWLFCSVLFWFLGCTKPKENLVKQEAEFQKNLLEQIEVQKERNSSTLNWEQALKLLLENNLELESAKESKRMAKEQKQQIFLDLLPTLSLECKSLQGTGGFGHNYGG